jgi:hypothetical protein
MDHDSIQRLLSTVLTTLIGGGNWEIERNSRIGYL